MHIFYKWWIVMKLKSFRQNDPSQYWHHEYWSIPFGAIVCRYIYMDAEMSMLLIIFAILQKLESFWLSQLYPNNVCLPRFVATAEGFNLIFKESKKTIHLCFFDTPPYIHNHLNLTQLVGKWVRDKINVLICKTVENTENWLSWNWSLPQNWFQREGIKYVTLSKSLRSVD